MVWNPGSSAGDVGLRPRLSHHQHPRQRYLIERRFGCGRDPGHRFDLDQRCNFAPDSEPDSYGWFRPERFGRDCEQRYQPKPVQQHCPSQY